MNYANHLNAFRTPKSTGDSRFQDTDPPPPFNGTGVAFGEDVVRIHTGEGVWRLLGQAPVSLQKRRHPDNSGR